MKSLSTLYQSLHRHRAGIMEFTVTPSCLYSTFAVYTVSSIPFPGAPANEFTASISVKCYKTAEGYEDTLHFIFLLKTKESASLAWLFLHTGRWPACIESVFYWICGSRIFSLETLTTTSYVVRTCTEDTVNCMSVEKAYCVRKSSTITFLCNHAICNVRSFSTDMQLTVSSSQKSEHAQSVYTRP